MSTFDVHIQRFNDAMKFLLAIKSLDSILLVKEQRTPPRPGLFFYKPTRRWRKVPEYGGSFSEKELTEHVEKNLESLQRSVQNFIKANPDSDAAKIMKPVVGKLDHALDGKDSYAEILDAINQTDKLHSSKLFTRLRNKFWKLHELVHEGEDESVYAEEEKATKAYISKETAYFTRAFNNLLSKFPDSALSDACMKGLEAAKGIAVGKDGSYDEMQSVLVEIAELHSSKGFTQLGNRFKKLKENVGGDVSAVVTTVSEQKKPIQSKTKTKKQPKIETIPQKTPEMIAEDSAPLKMDMDSIGLADFNKGTFNLLSDHNSNLKGIGVKWPTTKDGVRSLVQEHFGDFDYEQPMKRMLEDSDIFIAIKDANLIKVINDRFLSSTESGKGTFSHKSWKRFKEDERQLYGYPDNSNENTIDPKLLPKYGFLGSKDKMDNKEIMNWGYGNTFVQLRRSAKNKASFTNGNSLDNNNNAAMIAPPISMAEPDIDLAMLSNVIVSQQVKGTPDIFESKLKEGWKDNSTWKNFTTSSYIEAQIFGELNPNDIEAVHVESTRYAKRVKESLQKVRLQSY